METESFPIEKMVARYLVEYNSQIKVTILLENSASNIHNYVSGDIKTVVDYGPLKCEFKTWGSFGHIYDGLCDFKCRGNRKKNKWIDFKPALIDKVSSISFRQGGDYGLHISYKSNSQTLTICNFANTTTITGMQPAIAGEIFVDLYKQLALSIEKHTPQK